MDFFNFFITLLDFFSDVLKNLIKRCKFCETLRISNLTVTVFICFEILKKFLSILKAIGENFNEIFYLVQNLWKILR